VKTNTVIAAKEATAVTTVTTESKSTPQLKLVLSSTSGDKSVEKMDSVQLKRIAVEEEKQFSDYVRQFLSNVDTEEVPPAVKEITKSFLEQISKDRAALNQRIHDLDQYFRRRDFEYKGKETSFKEQMRLKDEQFKQKEYAFKQIKGTLANTTAALEKSRQSSAATPDKAELEHKYYTSEKLLSLAKENNERMTKRLEETQKKWTDEFNTRSSVQQELSKLKKTNDELKKKVNATSSSKVESKEMNQMTQQRDMAVRVIDTLKRQNKELQDKLLKTTAAAKPTAAAAAAAADSTKRASTQAGAEMKHKADQALKIQKAMKDEIDKYKKRCDEMKQQETKLRLEIVKLQNQLKTSEKGAK
jgi:chromosome segregation ATPase